MSTTGLWDIDQVSYIGIYPPIGIARVGNSVDADGWYYAPEVPGRFDEPQGGFKDADGAVKRQASPNFTTLTWLGSDGNLFRLPDFGFMPLARKGESCAKPMRPMVSNLTGPLTL